MSAFALSGLAVALTKLNTAIANIENYCDRDDAANGAREIGDAFSQMLMARGHLTSVIQLLEMELALGCAPTQPAPPLLRIVQGGGDE